MVPNPRSPPASLCFFAIYVVNPQHSLSALSAIAESDGGFFLSHIFLSNFSISAFQHFSVFPPSLSASRLRVFVVLPRLPDTTAAPKHHFTSAELFAKNAIMQDATTFDIAAARRTFAQRNMRRREQLHEMARQAQADFNQIRDMLVRDYHPKRIYQWGSLLTPEKFQEISDIDIAVEGLTDPIAGLHALDDACQLTRFPVDLVELERIHPTHAETIRTQGKLVYEHDA